MINDLIEFLGILCLGAFAWFLWWPSVFLVAGVYLILVANARAGRRRARPEPSGRGSSVINT